MVDLAAAAAPDKSRQGLTLIAIDWVEKAVLFLLFAGLLARIGSTLGERPFNFLLLISDGMVVVLVMFRRRTQAVSVKPMDWILALAATAAPLLAVGGGDPLIPEAPGVAIMAAGLVLSISAKVILWRSFGVVAANRGVKRSGPYRFVRHPMYLGYTITQIGFLLLNPTWPTAGLYAAGFCLQVLRLKAEEGLLSQDPAYAAYQTQVRFRLIPGLF